MEDRNKPNFFIVGAGKTGTTAVYEYLSLDERFFFPTIKEPCFFAFENCELDYKYGQTRSIINNITDYRSLYKNINSSSKIIGDASTLYLYYYEAFINGIKRHYSQEEVDNIKILIFLRNPVERAYSNYLMRVRNTYEDLSFEDALSQEDKRIKERYHYDFYYKSRSLYAEGIAALKDNFKNVKVIFHEDLKDDFFSVINVIYELVELSPPDERLSENKAYNKSGVPKIKILNRLVFTDNRIKRWIRQLLPKPIKETIYNLIYSINLKKSSIKKETYNRLVDCFQNDIRKTEKILSVDLANWKKKKK